jgi:hypothetical protein
MLDQLAMLKADRQGKISETSAEIRKGDRRDSDS